MIYEDLINNINTVFDAVEKAKASAMRVDCVTVVGASKTMPYEVVEMVNKCGLLKALGENKAQEFRDKFRVEHNFEWHFIGTLQTNKIKYIVGKAKLIESVDSFELAKDISEYAVGHNVCQNILLQVNMGKEINKFGVLPENLESQIVKVKTLEGVCLMGIMAVMPLVEQAELIKLYKDLKVLFYDLKVKYNLQCLSAGMSNDYQLAIEFGGANIVRVGRAIFGERV